MMPGICALVMLATVGPAHGHSKAHGYGEIATG
jgi:hypothetical protein